MTANARCTAARDMLLALCYQIEHRDHPLVAPDAIFPSNPDALDLLRTSHWRYPDIEEQSVTFTNADRSAMVVVAFDGAGRIERVAVLDSARAELDC